MKFSIKEYTLELIDDPKPRHVIAFEKSARYFRNEQAKPLLNDAMAELKKIDIASAADDNKRLVNAFMLISTSLQGALEIINNNEALTSTADDVLAVKASIQSGWIVSCRNGKGEVFPDLESVDDIGPPWLVSWIARTVMKQYVEVMTIPKN